MILLCPLCLSVMSQLSTCKGHVSDFSTKPWNTKSSFLRRDNVKVGDDKKIQYQCNLVNIFAAQKGNAGPPGYRGYAIPPSSAVGSGSCVWWKRFSTGWEAHLPAQPVCRCSAACSTAPWLPSSSGPPAAGRRPALQTEAGDGVWEHESCPDSNWLDRSGYKQLKIWPTTHKSSKNNIKMESILC